MTHFSPDRYALVCERIAQAAQRSGRQPSEVELVAVSKTHPATTLRQAEEEGIDTSPLLVEGPTVQTILKKIDKFEIDLVVLGTHGHGSLYSMVIGSTSQSLANKCPIPLLMVPSKN